MRISRGLSSELRRILAATGDDDLFPELALTLYVFIRRLHARLNSDGHADVYFLSREGQPLQTLYEMYAGVAGGSCARPHYLEVSRRSTLLPSLGALDGESFETLFRQYRAIAVEEFLASLGLENELEYLAGALDVSASELKVRRSDLPTDPLFAALIGNRAFAGLYERERIRQREAFLRYFQTLRQAGSGSSRVALVDVGWKGTIQDNLREILAASGVSEVHGYYLGLVAAGRETSSNSKHGLLFSALPCNTKGFHVFSENRALFEIMLAADHPSVWRYRTDDRPGPVYGPFDEEEMVRTEVLPLQRRAIERFAALSQLSELAGLQDEALERLAIGNHARMVFRPRPAERAWFTKVFHVENFGVFEHSTFSSRSGAVRVGDRARFCYRLLRRPRQVELGFWPYKTLLESAGYPAALAYALSRRLQPH